MKNLNFFKTKFRVVEKEDGYHVQARGISTFYLWFDYSFLYSTQEHAIEKANELKNYTLHKDKVVYEV